MMAEETPKHEDVTENETPTEAPANPEPATPAQPVVDTRADERPAPAAPAEPAQHSASHGDTTVILGRELPVPLYTAVFFALGILTFSEVLIAELLSSVPVIKIPLLVTIATAKAVLVVVFYMHLNTDSRLFAITLAVPVGMALIATLYLIAVPSTY